MLVNVTKTDADRARNIMECYAFCPEATAIWNAWVSNTRIRKSLISDLDVIYNDDPELDDDFTITRIPQIAD